MRLLLSSILVSLMLTAGCSKNSDDAATGETMMDKATKSTINSSTDKAADISQDRTEALKELDAMHEAATAGDTTQDTANDAMKDLKIKEVEIKGISDK